jgi:hypothetical protein
VSERLARDAWRELPLTIEKRQVERIARTALGGGIRRTALIRLAGGGLEGVGEEVTFQPAELLAESPAISWLFSGALGDFCGHLETAELFGRPPEFEAVRCYRRWAYEASALDLALRQQGKTLADLFGMQPHPVRFVVSPPPGRVDEVPTGARLKIDAVDIRPGLQIDVIDFKGQGDEALVECALALYPNALLEDPPVVVAGGRISWDVGISAVDDIQRLPERPAAINVKPARIGSLAELLSLYAYCEAQEIETYGGGQHELGRGRGQIQQLAALFHPDEPNDVAPAAYNQASPVGPLPTSPLVLAFAPGFG